MLLTVRVCQVREQGGNWLCWAPTSWPEIVIVNRDADSDQRNHVQTKHYPTGLLGNSGRHILEPTHTLLTPTLFFSYSYLPFPPYTPEFLQLQTLLPLSCGHFSSSYSVFCQEQNIPQSSPSRSSAEPRACHLTGSSVSEGS